MPQSFPIASRLELLADIKTLSKTELRRKYEKEANSHKNMKSRCKADEKLEDPKRLLHPEFSDFADFLRHVGPAPSPDSTIDRINNEDPMYGPGTVRWASKVDQTRNRSNTRMVAFEGKTITLAEFAEMCGAPYSTISSRLERGATAAQIYGDFTGSTSADEDMLGWRPQKNRASWEAQFREWRGKTRQRKRKAEAFEEVLFILKFFPIYEKIAKEHSDASEGVSPGDPEPEELREISTRLLDARHRLSLAITSLSRKGKKFVEFPRIGLRRAFDRCKAHEQYLHAPPPKSKQW